MQLLELAQSARRLFEQQEAREKRRLLDFVVSNCSWKAGELSVKFRQPFDILANATTAAAAAEPTETSDFRVNLRFGWGTVCEVPTTL